MRLPQVQQTNTGVLDVRDPTQNVVVWYKMVQVHISIQYNRMHACDILTMYRVFFFNRVSSWKTQVLCFFIVGLVLDFWLCFAKLSDFHLELFAFGTFISERNI